MQIEYFIVHINYYIYEWNDTSDPFVYNFLQTTHVLAIVKCKKMYYHYYTMSLYIKKHQLFSELKLFKN